VRVSFAKCTEAVKDVEACTFRQKDEGASYELGKVEIRPSRWTPPRFQSGALSKPGDVANFDRSRRLGAYPQAVWRAGTYKSGHRRAQDRR